MWSCSVVVITRDFDHLLVLPDAKFPETQVRTLARPSNGNFFHTFKLTFAMASLQRCRKTATTVFTIDTIILQSCQERCAPVSGTVRWCRMGPGMGVATSFDITAPKNAFPHLGAVSFGTRHTLFDIPHTSRADE